MGKKARPRPQRLPAKLLQIREALGFSQSEMLKHLGYDSEMVYARISEYELGKNEPPLPVLLEYARIANVWVDVLIDDELDLPAKLPGRQKHGGVKRTRN
jgi:transcriptional regulator with XRE-family HTH domain